ncbi:MAG TPA: hypothetical protein VMC06_09875 [Opitutaceae bacterium]|nr:hypothetical protein [Opitutaceae bacterium]
MHKFVEGVVCFLSGQRTLLSERRPHLLDLLSKVRSVVHSFIIFIRLDDGLISPPIWSGDHPYPGRPIGAAAATGSAIAETVVRSIINPRRAYGQANGL